MYKNEWQGKDFYALLGVSKAADESEIKKAYRKLARKYHPDTNQEPGAEAKFKEVSEAFEVLSNAEKRSAYDSGGNDPFAGLFGNMAGTGDPFDFETFSREQRDTRKHYEDFLNGSNSDLNDLLDRANRINQERSGKVDREPMTPPRSGGLNFKDFIDTAKAKASNVASGFGGEKNAPSSDTTTPTEELELTITFRESCNGAVKQVKNSAGQLLNVRIPAGIKDGQKIRLSTEGNPEVRIKVEKNKFFSREGDDLIVRWPVQMKQAIRGGVISIPVPHDEPLGVRLTPMNANKTLKVAGRGFKGGDMLLTPYIELPDSLTPEQEDQLVNLFS